LKDWTGSKVFVRYLLVDAAGCAALVLLLFTLDAPHWFLASICAFLAASPDFLWIRKFIASQKGEGYKYSRLERFLGWIQWFQRPIGAFVELVWFAAASVLLWQFL
jgi:hypothetical protein